MHRHQNLAPPYPRRPHPAGGAHLLWRSPGGTRPAGSALLLLLRRPRCKSQPGTDRGRRGHSAAPIPAVRPSSRKDRRDRRARIPTGRACFCGLRLYGFAPAHRPGRHPDGRSGGERRPGGIGAPIPQCFKRHRHADEPPVCPVGMGESASIPRD